MSIREFEYTNGTKLRLKGNLHEGKIGIDSDGFSFNRGVGQDTLVELLPPQCTDIDLSQGNVFRISLTSNISNFNVSNSAASTYLFIFVQDSTGGKTVTFPSNFYFISGLGPPDFSGDSANTINIISFLCDGSGNFFGTYMQNFVNS